MATGADPMDENTPSDDLLAGLNTQQRQAVKHGKGPLLVVAGAGTGKTTTLVHRVLWLIATGVNPGRILLLTFTRRAAAQMIRRVDSTLRSIENASSAKHQNLRGARVWGGTFHAISTRLLRQFGKAIRLDPGFTIHDRADSEDLLNVVRTELGFAKTDRRFPKKGTCMNIYSRCVNAQTKLDQVLIENFPWCEEWSEELAKLFDAYVDRKETASALDYDDLLLYWHAVMDDPKAGAAVRDMFDCVLVDEYQDTNTLQAEILYRLCPDGRGLTVVGDDAQSIYSFRAATVRNILDFPKHFADTTVVPLEQNYRSTQAILDATNCVISQAKERYTKNLWSGRTEGDRPSLVTCESEADQADFVTQRILEHREGGIDLRRQAILFRASHHSILLEAELTRRKIPFHKYGGLKFIETAHVKDLMSFLRLAENPRDLISGMRLLTLLPGIGPRKARQLMDTLLDTGGNFNIWINWKPPAAAKKIFPRLVKLLSDLSVAKKDLPAQVNRARKFYTPLLEDIYDNARPRSRDLEQIEQIASRYRDRRTMLAEITLDPPASTQDLAGPPLLDDDYLILSTIHSAKGLEWDSVYVIHAADGNIPSDMSTGSPEEIEEELRLFYVAMTRAKRWLYVCCPLRYYRYPGSHSDAHGYAQVTRFINKQVKDLMNWSASETSDADLVDEEETDFTTNISSQSIRRRTKDFWSQE